MMWLLNLVNPLKAIGDQLNRAYEMKLLAMTDKERLDAEKQISQIEANRDLLLREQGSWMTRWVRPMMALPVVIYVWKVVVWDTVLKWGVTPYPGEFVHWYVLTVTGAYFVMRPIEKWGRG